MTPKEFEAQLIRHEGKKSRVYKDSLGIETIGVGRNLRDKGLTNQEIMFLLRNDIEQARFELELNFPIVDEIGSDRYYVLVNMLFNMGLNRLKGFRKMWAALKRHDYDQAANEMLDSKWARQVKGRAVELAGVMRVGDHQNTTN